MFKAQHYHEAEDRRKNLILDYFEGLKIQKMVKIEIIYRYTYIFKRFRLQLQKEQVKLFFVTFEQYFTQKYMFLISRNIMVTDGTNSQDESSSPVHNHKNNHSDTSRNAAGNNGDSVDGSAAEMSETWEGMGTGIDFT